MKTTTAVILLFLVSVAVSQEEPQHPTRKFTRIVNYVYDAYNAFKNFFWNSLFGSDVKYQEKTNPPGDTAANPPDDAKNNLLEDPEKNPPKDTETNPPYDPETNDGSDDNSLTETTTPKEDWRKSTKTRRRRTKQTPTFLLCTQHSESEEETCVPIFYPNNGNRNRM